MNKGPKILTAILVTFFIGLSFSLALAEEGFTNTGNDRKGKYIFRKNCRSCHDGSSAESLSPNSKTQAQWERTFEKMERLKCVDEWKKIEQKDLNDVFTYLYNHGYDSPQPATCK